MSNGDVFLRCALPIKDSPNVPPSNVVIETLVKLAHTMQETPFQWTFVDKPKAGTSAIVYHDPARPWPSDGIRYSHAESTSTSSTGWSHGRATVETCITTSGIYPPSNPAVPLPLDTPELNLARYRLRFRIIPTNEERAGHPALWYVFWGRDDRGGQRAPPGWEREAIRRYPLPSLNEPYQYPLKGIPPLQAVLPQQPQQPQLQQGGPGQGQQNQQMSPQQQQQRMQMQMQQQQQLAQRTPMQLQQGQQNPQYMQQQQQQQTPQSQQQQLPPGMPMQGQPGLGPSPMSLQQGQVPMPGLAQSRPRSTAAMQQQPQPQQPSQQPNQMTQQQLHMAQQQQQMQMQQMQMMAARQQQQERAAQGQILPQQQQGRPNTGSMPGPQQQQQQQMQMLPNQLGQQQPVSLPPQLAAAGAQNPKSRKGQPPGMVNGTVPQQMGPAQVGPPMPASQQPGPSGLPQPQITHAQLAQNAQQLAHARQTMSTATFPAPFDDLVEGDPYELLSDRAWAGLRYERNHALVAPIFDAATVEDCLVSWKAPALPTLEELKAQIKAAEEEIVALRKAGDAQLAALKFPSSAAAAATTTAAAKEGSAPVRSASMTGPSSTSMDARRPSVMGTGGDPLLAPLPQVMSIAEMEEGALQAITARRQAIEQVQKQKEAAAAAEREAEERLRREEAEASSAQHQQQQEEERQSQMQTGAESGQATQTESADTKEPQQQEATEHAQLEDPPSQQSQPVQQEQQSASADVEPVRQSQSALSPLPGASNNDEEEDATENIGQPTDEGGEGDLDFSLITGGQEGQEDREPSHDVFASYHQDATQPVGQQQEYGNGGSLDEDAYLYAAAASGVNGYGGDDDLNLLGEDGMMEESLFDTYFNQQHGQGE